jgi:FAD/FMN-containing dehydrogenase
MPSLADDLISLLGPDRVSVTDADLATHSTDKWFASNPPQVVVHAQSTEDVSKTLRYANEHSIPVTAQGARVGYVGGCVPSHGGIALSVFGMNRILEINTADGVAVVEPGVITGELQKAVRELGWFYPPDPASLKECSLGGNIATNAGGPRCLKYGVTRHYVLGLEAVHPPTRAMLSAGFRTFAEAANAVQRILNSGFLPSALEIADKFTLRAAREYLGESVTPQGDAHLLVEIDGHEPSVKGELALLAQLVRDLGSIDLEEAMGEAACERFWKLRREFSYSLRNTGLIKLNEDIVVPRSKLVDLVEFAERLQSEHGFPVACFGHAGDGNIHVNIMVPTMDDPAIRERAETALDQLFRQIIAWNGAITGEHGVGIAKKRWWREAVTDATHEAHLRVKAALDPKSILNPGKFLG